MELTTNYRVASIIKLSGFGVSVVQRLCKTSVKKNLYWEVKDKVIEETYNGVRMDRKPRKVKVYGLDSSKGSRDLLIEILRERMERHKDKMPSPTMYDELSKMVVKKNGKVEHSDNSHDDLVFSYLMALYVWYEGKYLKENFNIDKGVIKTEDSVDDNIGKDLEQKYTEIVEEFKIPIEDENSTRKEVDECLKTLKIGMGTMFSEFMKKQRDQEEQMLMDMIQNKAVRKAYAEYSQIPEEQLISTNKANKFKIPDSVFTNFGEDPEEIAKKQIAKNMNFKNFKGER